MEAAEQHNANGSPNILAKNRDVDAQALAATASVGKKLKDVAGDFGDGSGEAQAWQK